MTNAIYSFCVYDFKIFCSGISSIIHRYRHSSISDGPLQYSRVQYSTVQYTIDLMERRMGWTPKRKNANWFDSIWFDSLLPASSSSSSPPYILYIAPYNQPVFSTALHTFSLLPPFRIPERYSNRISLSLSLSSLYHREYFSSISFMPSPIFVSV